MIRFAFAIITILLSYVSFTVTLSAADATVRESIISDNASPDRLRVFSERDHVIRTGKFAFDGFVQLKYIGIQDYKSNLTQSIYSYLDFNTYNTGLTGLSIHFNGMMKNGIVGADALDDLNIYYGYIQYETFQKALDLKLGRFDLINNAYMTLDGVEAKYKTPFYFGVLAYGGIPYYKNFENRKEVFRNTGDLLFGGRVFLSGIKNTEAYIGYSRETGKLNTGSYGVFREAISLGGSYFHNLSVGKNLSSIIGTGLIEYDPSNNLLSRASLKGNYRWNILQVTLFGDYFNIKDQYPKGRELIIQLLSTGEEAKVGGDIGVRYKELLTVSAGAFFSNVNTAYGSEQAVVYRLRFDSDFVKKAGVFFGGELYLYDTTRADSFGASVMGEWRFTQDLSFNLSGEYAYLNRANLGKDAVNAYSVRGELKVYLTNLIQAAVFFEKGSNIRFIDDMRFGVLVRYDFYY